MRHLNEEQRARVVALENLGSITPQDVLDDARAPDSPLHGLFQWDDATAAEAHRLDQAREVIRQVRVTVVTTTRAVQINRYVGDPAVRPESGYVATDSLNSLDRRIDVVRSEATRAIALMKRVEDLATVLDLDVGLIDGTLSRWQLWQANLDSRDTGTAAAAD
jgi:hypothetical protein